MRADKPDQEFKEQRGDKLMFNRHFVDGASLWKVRLCIDMVIRGLCYLD